MTEPLVLGIDLGTQGVELLCLDGASGTVAAQASRPLDLITGLPQGHSEQHPRDWLAAIEAAAGDLDAGVRARVAAIGVSGQQHGLVPVDADGAVIRPAKLWNDVSAAAECAEVIAEVGGADALFARTGNGLAPGFTGGKLRWLRDHEPANLARIATVLLPHDYVNFWLTGERTCEDGDASGTGYFDVRTREFDLDLLEQIAPGASGFVPRRVRAGDVCGTLRAATATALGLPAGIPVSAGGGDNMMSALGAGAVEAGVVVVSLGTSGTVFAHTDEALCDPRGEIAAFCGSGDHGWLPLGCTMNATVSSETARGMFGMDLPAFEAAIAGATPGSDGLLCLPFFTGERSPNLPDATASVHGLTPSNARAANVTRAAVEGATFALVELLDRMAELGVSVREIRLTGGGSQSPTWRAILAAAAGAPVRTGVHPDAAALGAAVQGLWTLRRTENAAATLAETRSGLGLDADLDTLEPDPAWTAAYAETRARYRALVQRLHGDH